MNARSHMYMCLTAKMVVEGKGGERGKRGRKTRMRRKGCESEGWVILLFRGDKKKCCQLLHIFLQTKDTDPHVKTDD